jgi:hypothetical protein
MQPADPLLIREIALETQTDPRSVAREIRGQRVRGLAGARIRRALHSRDLPSSERKPEAA